MTTSLGSLYCPTCGGVLVPYAIKTKSGSEAWINYCYSCGGVWCDHWIANKVSYNEFKELTHDLPKYHDKEPTFGNQTCPYCQVVLQHLVGENIPENLTVFSCPQCLGNWFPYGEFTRFKKAQEAKLDYLKIWQIPLKSVYQVLLPIIVISLIGISIPVTIYVAQKRTEESIIASEYVKNIQVIPTGSGQVTIVFTTTVALPSEILYGPEKNNLQRMSVSVTAETLHQIKLINLVPGQVYYYQLILHKDGRAQILPLASFSSP